MPKLKKVKPSERSHPEDWTPITKADDPHDEPLTGSYEWSPVYNVIQRTDELKVAVKPPERPR